MTRDHSAEHRSLLLNEFPNELAARVERNRVWMDRFGGDRGLAALTQPVSQASEGEGKESDEEENKKKGEPKVKKEEEEPYNPPAPEWDEQDPDNIEQEPPVDPLYCQFCLYTPCLFLQWQEDIEQAERLMYPDKTNRAKRFIFYRRMTRELYGHLGKGVRKPLPRCFVQGARDLYPNGEAEDVYTGFKRGPGGDGDESSIS
jgi:class 3 adenylate cyclase